jgi:glycosyltransferase involved in cell wall biosynthesis
VDADTARGTPADAPRFSVLVPVWNGASFVGGAIDSVLAQSGPTFECVVSDNASDDDPRAVVEARRDPRLRLHAWPDHVAIFDSFNRGLTLCRGEWVFLLPADDRLLPGCLARIAERIDAYRGARGLAAVFPRASRIDPDGHPIDVRYHGHQGEAVLRDGVHDARSWLLATSAPGSPPWDGAAIRRSVIDAMGVFFRPDIPSMSGDLELAVRLGAYGDVVYIDEPLMAVTGWPGSHTPSRVRANLERREPWTPRGIAHREGLRAHEAVREVGRDERAAVDAAIARTHLRRATAQRTGDGGRGRRGAAEDIVAAARLAPAVVLRSLPLALALVIAPAGMLRSARERALRRREARSLAQGADPRP